MAPKQKAKKKRKKIERRRQSFAEAAREIEADETGKDFEATFKKVVKPRFASIQTKALSKER